MAHRRDVLAPLGYEVSYQQSLRYRGSGETTICTAQKKGRRFYVFPARKHFARIQQVQASIPHMARIECIVRDVILFEEALGTRLWEFAPDATAVPEADKISTQLREFAEATTQLGLIHGDLRPWNVIVGATLEIKVIDWGLSCFVDELPKRIDLTRQPGHYWNFSGGRPVEQLDLTDADRISRLMRGEITYSDAWKQTSPSWLPRWCRPPGS